MKKSRLFFILSIALVLVAVGWYLFIRFERCHDLECFKLNLAECSRAIYVNRGEWTYQYKIRGIKENECNVEVRLLFAGLEERFNFLIDNSMSCSMPLRMVQLPEENLAYCSGELKENLQYLVIRDLYLYSAQNLGK